MSRIIVIGESTIYFKDVDVNFDLKACQDIVGGHLWSQPCPGNKDLDLWWNEKDSRINGGSTGWFENVKSDERVFISGIKEYPFYICRNAGDGSNTGLTDEDVQWVENVWMKTA